MYSYSNFFLNAIVTLLAVICFSGASGRAYASCGLHVCPVPVARPQAEAENLALPPQLWLETRYTAFDIGGRGSYVQTAVRGSVELSRFRLGGYLPVVYLDGPTGSTTGLGNTLLFAELLLLHATSTRISIGSQLETPTGNHTKGLGANHFMAIPYLNFWQAFSDLRLALQLGYQQTLGAHEHGAASPVLYVNPHSDAEVITRAMASYTWQQIYTFELNASFRQVTAHDAVGDKTFADAGAALRIGLGQNLALRAGADLPLLSRARYLYQIYAGCFYYF